MSASNDHITQQISREYMRHIEQHGMTLRSIAGVEPLEPFNPRLYASKLRFKIVTLDSIEDLPASTRHNITMIDPREWSGISKPLPSGELLIVLNPNMTIERENVTIMEEVAHEYYKHKPVTLHTLSNGLVQRQFDPSTEREAYWTAASALLPSKAVGQAVYHGKSAEDVAVMYGTSVELVEMRIKTLRLWPHYNPTPLPYQRAS